MNFKSIHTTSSDLKKKCLLLFNKFHPKNPSATGVCHWHLSLEFREFCFFCMTQSGKSSGLTEKFISSPMDSTPLHFLNSFFFLWWLYFSHTPILLSSHCQTAEVKANLTAFKCCSLPQVPGTFMQHRSKSLFPVQPCPRNAASKLNAKA